MNNLTFQNLKPFVAQVPKASSQLEWPDIWGSIKVRWAVNRNNYTVNPGIYAVGQPNRDSDVLVTANYKLTFDIVRKNLKGFDVWLLVLDTKGINVWCAAGKGTFGTDELIRRINDVSLKSIVNHKRLIVPQLGAVGVAAHLVKQNTDFSVQYGPVRAKDIKYYLENNHKLEPEMRRVRFPLVERLKLIPVEFMLNLKYFLLSLAVMLLLSGLNRSGISFQSIVGAVPNVLINLTGAFLAGILLGPILLPYIPFRSFAMKGFISGLLMSILLLGIGSLSLKDWASLAWVMMIIAISSFFTMNFTGASTYTSLSGVLKEMKIAIPLQIGVAIIGLIIFVISNFV